MMYNHGPLFSTSDGVPPALKDGETSYTGQQAFSQILPATLHDVGETKIVSGELVAGQVKKLYQMQTTGILQRVQRRRQHGGRTHAGQHRTWRATG
jgi:hypothetical protein